MSGGKSSTTEQQSTAQSTVSGVNTGLISQGSSQSPVVSAGQTAFSSIKGNIHIDELQQIPPEVAGAFSKIIDTVNKALDINQTTVTAGQKIISDTTASAIQKVADRSEVTEQPGLAVVTKLIPVLTAGLVVVGLVMVFRK